MFSQKNQENSTFFCTFWDCGDVAGVHGPGLGCGHGRAYPGGQNKLKSKENTMLFNSFLEQVAKT